MKKGLEKTLIYELAELSAFNKFSKKELKQLVQGADLVYLRQGDVLFHQGETSDSALILISGRLSAVLDWGGESPSFLGLVKPGDFVGEMGVIIGSPRSCSIIAQKDSRLLRIDETLFLEKMQSNLSLVMLINRILSLRLKNTIRKIHTRDLPRAIAIVPASELTDIDEFVLQTKRVLQESDLNYLVVDHIDALKTMGTNYTEIQLTNWLEEIETKYDFVFFIATNTDKKWFDYVLYKSDRVLMVCDVNKNSWGAEINKFLQAKPIGFSVKEVVLMHSPNDEIVNTQHILPNGFHGRFHHIFIDHKEDYQRLLRFITGSGIGVVLSGGGTRGWVHVGALLALQDYGVAIDAICGTSTGSLVSSIYLTSSTKEEFVSKVGNLFNLGKKSINWYDYTWPKVSLISGNTQYAKLIDVYGDKKIEDLRIPYMAVASNLSKAEQVIIRRDLLRQAIRSSCSIPGIVPPMLQDGDLIVDGGILNNLPTDIMNNFMESKGFIIAVDLSLTEINDTFHFPPVLTVKDYFRNRFNKHSKKFRLPSMGNIIMQSISIGSSQLMHNNKRLADIFIQPQLFGASMLSNPDHQKLLDAGYNETIKQLKAWEKEQGQTLKEFAKSLRMSIKEK